MKSESRKEDSQSSTQSLDDLGRRFKTDKSSLEHNYLVSYQEFIPFSRGDSFVFIEIGVFRGASARMWAEWFFAATVVGIDLRPPKLKQVPKNLKLISSDATKSRTLQKLQNNFASPKVILDDGSHQWAHQRESLKLFWPWLSSGGVYIIEDLHSSSEPGFAKDDATPFVELLLKASYFLHLRGAQKEHFLSVLPEWLANVYLEIRSLTFIESSVIISKR